MIFEACPVCDSRPLARLFHYTAPPEGETPFEPPPGQAYERAFLRCERCRHLAGSHELDFRVLYSGV